MRPTMPKLPASLRIAHADFKVTEWSPSAANARHRWGECSVNEMEIRIQCRDRCYPEILATLLHEIYHALYWAYELEDADKEERICGAMAVGLTQVFRDNPALVEFIEHARKYKP